jgi:hypothetical protein
MPSAPVRPGEPPPPRPLYQADVFGDATWAELVRTEPRPDPAQASGPPRLSRAREDGATLQPLQRQSIDQDVLQQIILDRARRVSMRAVADVLEAAVGEGVTRQYVKDLVERASALLVDRTGMQNTLVEQLVATLVRAIVADAVVRLRFDGDAIGAACAWRRQVFDDRAGDDAAQCRSRAIERLERSCGGPEQERPVACALAVREGDAYRPWAPPEVDDDAGRRSAHARLRGYLVDLAYWSLGRTPLFARRARLPGCAFPAGDPSRRLCEFVEGPADEDERARRAAWLVGTQDLLSAIQIAHDVLGVLRPPATTKLQTLVEALVERTELGAFREGWLDPDQWDLLADVATWAELTKALRSVSNAIATLETDERTTETSVARLKTALTLFDDQVARACGAAASQPPLPTGPPPPAGAPATSPGAATSPSPVLGPFCSAAFATRPAPGCEAVPTTLRGWARAVREQNLAERAGQQPMGQARQAALCVPADLAEALARFRGSGNAVRDLDASLDKVVRLGGSLRSEVRETRALLPRRVEEIRLDRLDALVAALERVAGVVEALDEELRRGPVAGLLRLRIAPLSLGYASEQYRRAIHGVSRVLQLVSIIDDRALRERGITSVGGAVRALRSLGGPLLSRLGPVLPYVRTTRQITIESMLVLLDQLNVEDIVVALGLDVRPRSWCEEDEKSLACWVQRIVMVLREATDVSEDRVSIDGNRLVKTLGALGDDFRRRTEWRWYFHLTIGLGQMAVWAPDRVYGGGRSTFGASDARVVPLMAEQVGLGYASPSFAGDRFGLRFGVFGSGLLYRLVLDSQESDAFFFGGFAALDLYELLEIYVAPSLMVFPADDAARRPTYYGFSLSVGASVPLGDYLSRL